MAITYQSEYADLKSLFLKHPKEAFKSQEFIDANWKNLNYLAKPDFSRAIDEYDQLLDIFHAYDIKTSLMCSDNTTGLDSLYVRDASITTDQGVIICNMGKDQRNYEPKQHLQEYLELNKPILGTIQSPGMLEGGDVAWINNEILAVARGYRTNDEGIEQLGKFLQHTVKDILVMHSPHYKGPSDVFHLMSVLSPIDKDLAVVYSPLMTVPFRIKLIDLGFELIEVPDEEFDSLGCNILAIAPRVCLMVKGNPITKSRLEQKGVEVIEFDGNEICLKGSGGPTCLTRPLERQT